MYSVYEAAPTQTYNKYIYVCLVARLDGGFIIMVTSIWDMWLKWKTMGSGICTSLYFFKCACAASHAIHTYIHIHGRQNAYVYMYVYVFGVYLSLLLFCAPDDIEVIFFEEKDDDGMHPAQPWVAKGRFGPNDVHHQVCSLGPLLGTQCEMSRRL